MQSQPVFSIQDSDSKASCRIQTLARRSSTLLKRNVLWVPGQPQVMSCRVKFSWCWWTSSWRGVSSLKILVQVEEWWAVTDRKKDAFLSVQTHLAQKHVFRLAHGSPSRLLEKTCNKHFYKFILFVSQQNALHNTSLAYLNTTRQKTCNVKDDCPDISNALGKFHGDICEVNISLHSPLVV